MRARDSLVHTPVSLGPDTDDEETLVNAQVYINDLAQIRALVESTGMLGGSSCPSCEMPFDKGKKRRLIDSCGHERCYSCLFRSEACPLCLRAHLNDEEDEEYDFREDSDWIINDSSTVDSPCRNRNLNRGEAPKMTQSCPTPPNQRKRFFLNPKVLRSSFASQRTPEPIANDNPSALSAWMEGKSRWPGVVLGKIKSLWNNSEGTANDGLNQLVNKMRSDDEGGCVKPLSSKTRKSSQSDLYMRLGLLLGGNNVTHNSKGPSSRTCQDSFSSLTSYETQTGVVSVNTSPVSTLTGTSSEAEIAASKKLKSKGKKFTKRELDSAESLASISSMSMSMSVSVSGLSNSSSSPLSSRKDAKRSSVRRLPRGIIESKLRFIQQQQLALKPLFFEVPLLELDPLFMGRHWLLREIETVITGSASGMLIFGSPGTGKTALILQLVEHGCFGRRREPRPQQNDTLSEKIRELASYVVAYHFCQADNNSSCLVPDMVHSLAAQLCQAPHLISYREYLMSETHLQATLSQRECTVDPDLALARGIIEPLLVLKKANKLPDTNMVILIDAVCEAEYHRPDRGDTIASFLSRHAPNFPSWLKIICTVRTSLLECAKQFPYTRISLDKTGHNIGNVTKDISDYIGYRFSQSTSIQSNVSCGSHQTKFTSHLLSLTEGSFLFAKLVLDLIESGHLVTKSASYKVLPVSLAQIFQLHFNLRFPTETSFDKIQPLLGVCLAALYPLTVSEIFYSVNSLYTNEYVSWEDFMQRFNMLTGFLVKRLDNTYMFFHPSFREWLMRRDEGDSSKFLCDLRLGHAAIAYRLSRIEFPLDGEKSLELGHHILKAHVYRGVGPCWPSRDLQAIWLTKSAGCVSAALCALRNIYSPNVKVSRLLLLAGASPNHKTEYLGNAPVLCMYAHEGSVEMVSLLLEFGADVELTNSQGCTALSLAAARGHCDVVRRLCAAGASLGHTDMSGQCALVHAAKQGRLSVVGYLLACDWVRVEREEAAQQSVVAAASQGHESVVEYLLDMSEVVIDQQDSLMSETALTVAAANGSTGTVGALLMRGADPAMINGKGMSPLMLAAREGHWGTAETLLQGTLLTTDIIKSLLDQRDSTGRNPLMIAACEGHTNLIELFLEKGSLLESKDKEGLTALGWACVRGRLATVRNLIEHGVDVNSNDFTGRTPLDLAAFQGNPKLVQLLLEKGAVVEHVDLHGMRPLDRAIGCRNIPVVQCFLRRGAKLGPATWAMAAGKPDCLLILLNKLLEDGNVLYRKGRLKEASHRYLYALRKFPVTSEDESFVQLRLNFLLNLSRCKRRMNEYVGAIELADQALTLRPSSYEAFYARAKAKIDAGSLEEALTDIQEALRVAPPQNRSDRRVLVGLKKEILFRLEGSNDAQRLFRGSRDTLTEL